MNDRVPEGSYAAGRRVRLPAGAEPPISVFVNGVPQEKGVDYRIERGHIVFSRSILKEEAIGLARWTAMFLGLFGTYRTHETVDIEYRRDGRPTLASDLPIEE